MKAQNSDIKSIDDTKKDAKQTRISAMGVSLGRKVRKHGAGSVAQVSREPT